VKGAAEPPPTLRDVARYLRSAAPRALLLVDAKVPEVGPCALDAAGAEEHGRRLGRAVARTLAEEGVEAASLVAGPPGVLEGARGVLPRLTTLALASSAVEASALDSRRVSGVSLPASIASAPIVAAARARGLLVDVYVVNSTAEIRRLVEAGVDFLETDEVLLSRRALAGR
jgi:glycerophosphoryl diester phosphodiesterase